MICGVNGREHLKTFLIFTFSILLCNYTVDQTHNDYGAGDGDGSHGSMRNGVSPVGIADALVIAVDSSLVRGEHQRQDS